MKNECECIECKCETITDCICTCCDEVEEGINCNK